jgi:hypothetical protein
VEKKMTPDDFQTIVVLFLMWLTVVVTVIGYMLFREFTEISK